MEKIQTEFCSEQNENNSDSQCIEMNIDSVNKIGLEYLSDQMDSDSICEMIEKDLCDEIGNETLNTVNNDFGKVDDSPNQQDLRAEMRSRFLWMCSSLTGKETDVSMYENITVKGVCKGLDKDIQLMHLQNMETPFLTYAYGTVRLPDCLIVKFKMDK